MKTTTVASALLALVGLVSSTSTSSASCSSAISTSSTPTFNSFRASATTVASLAARQDALGGALDSTHAISVNIKAIPTPPPYVTIALINNAGPPTGGQPASGTLGVGARAQIVYPTGWAGRIAVNDAKHSSFRGDESLVEASFTIQKDVSEDFATYDINVSYVDGHTLPIVCTCAANGARLSGCDVKLWNQALVCPENNGNGACKNPHRYDNLIQVAHPSFAACANQAYTFPDNNEANSNGECQSGLVECRVYSAK
ncbi:hypothetical protein OQA88_10601 [Cercophora sp. LCS_1]